MFFKKKPKAARPLTNKEIALELVRLHAQMEAAHASVKSHNCPSALRLYNIFLENLNKDTPPEQKT